jgi:hypothetical protein
MHDELELTADQAAAMEAVEEAMRMVVRSLREVEAASKLEEPHAAPDVVRRRVRLRAKTATARREYEARLEVRRETIHAPTPFRRRTCGPRRRPRARPGRSAAARGDPSLGGDDPPGEPAGEAHQHELDRRRARQSSDARAFCLAVLWRRLSSDSRRHATTTPAPAPCRAYTREPRAGGWADRRDGQSSRARALQAAAPDRPSAGQRSRRPSRAAARRPYKRRRRRVNAGEVRGGR